jgi:signal transduction histidine kinase
VSHDLQTPTVTLCGFADLLLEECSEELKEQGRLYTKHIRESAEGLKDLINGLLEYSRIEPSLEDAEVCDIGELVRRAHDILEFELVGSGGSLSIDGDFPCLPCQPHRIEQVFFHLIQNAIRYRHPDRPLQVLIRCDENPGQWCFAVRDNGRGIPEEDVLKVLRPFERLGKKPRKGAVGMGLTIVRKIVESHGGQVCLTSTQDKGACASFTLPKQGIPAG